MPRNGEDDGCNNAESNDDDDDDDDDVRSASDDDDDDDDDVRSTSTVRRGIIDGGCIVVVVVVSFCSAPFSSPDFCGVVAEAGTGIATLLSTDADVTASSTTTSSSTAPRDDAVRFDRLRCGCCFGFFIVGPWDTSASLLAARTRQ